MANIPKNISSASSGIVSKFTNTASFSKEAILSIEFYFKKPRSIVYFLTHGISVDYNISQDDIRHINSLHHPDYAISGIVTLRDYDFGGKPCRETCLSTHYYLCELNYPNVEKTLSMPPKNFDTFMIDRFLYYKKCLLNNKQIFVEKYILSQFENRIYGIYRQHKQLLDIL